MGEDVANQRAGGKGIIGSVFGRTFERSIIEGGVFSFILLWVANLAMYYGFFRGIQDYGTRFAPFMAVFIAYLVINTSFMRYFKGLKRDFSCMTGCMMGMTTGMIAGFTLGAVVGATNGMLVGSLYGLFMGIVFGYLTGKCCGMMGIMEGMMAGLMGGFMGAMTSLMLLNDNIFIFLGILGVASVVILIALVKHLHIENKESEGHFKPMDMLTFFGLNLLIFVLTSLLIIYGPRSVIVAQVVWG